MTHRNHVPASTPAPKPSAQHHRKSWRIWGYCLSGMSILSSTIAQAQATLPATIAVETVPVAATPAVVESPAPVSTRANDLKPETALTVESATAEVPTEVPIQAPTQAPIEEPTEVPISVAPIVPEVTAKPVSKDRDAAPVVVITERQARPPAIVKNPVKKTTATQKSPISQPIKAAAPIAPIGESNIEVAPPIAAINEPIELASPEPIAVRLGPISLSSAGISLSPSAVMPYFDSKLQMSRVSGLENLRLMFPVAIPAPITSLFGWRIHPISGAQRMHTGTDIGAPMGTPVLAALSGRVILADTMGGYGVTVALEHENGMRQTLYAHMSELFVRPGDVIQQGTVIGRVGSTGASTGAHLHFELRQMLPDGTWVAQDAGQPLQIAMSTLVQSLQIAQRPQATIAQRLMPQRLITPNALR